MNLFSYIRSNLNIADVVKEHVTLKNTGIYLKGPCPFHSEKTGSFTVSPHRDIFYCFGCHASGDVIGFMAMLENCTQLEAAKMLVERYSMEPPQELLKETISAETMDAKKRYHKLCELMAEWCHEQLKKNSGAVTYLNERGFGDHTIKTFDIGYFPSGQASIKSLMGYLKKEGFMAKDALSANLIAESKSMLYSPFEERIIFPIRDGLGNVCAFGGRVFGEHDERAKYYNSRENPYFVKGSVLFGLEHAKRSIQKGGEVILVEGYTDCIALHQNGYDNCVATLGTACTPDHLAILARYADVLYILYDGDKAGNNAIARLTESCWNVNIELKVISLPNKEDPASFLEKGNELKPLKEQAHDIIDYFIQHSTETFKQQTLKQKLVTLHKIIDIIKKIPDQLKQSMVVQKAAVAFQVPAETLQKELNKSQTMTAQEPIKKSTEPGITTTSGNLEEKVFVSFIHLIETIDIEKYKYVITLLRKPLNSILQKLFEMKLKDHSLTFDSFWSTLNEEHQKTVAQAMIAYDQHIIKDSIEIIMNEFNKKHWKEIVYETKERIREAQAENNQEEVTKLITRMQEMKSKLVHHADTSQS